MKRKTFGKRKSRMKRMGGRVKPSYKTTNLDLLKQAEVEYKRAQKSAPQSLNLPKNLGN
jgi:hypothetical protein